MNHEIKKEPGRVWALVLLALLIGLALALLPLTLHAQQGVTNTFNVAQFAGADVGAKITAAQNQCLPNTAVPCTIVIDSILAVWPQGNLPARCSNCLWIDYRVAGVFAVAGSTSTTSGAITANIFGGTFEANIYATGGDGSQGNPWTSASGTGGIQEAINVAALTGGHVHLPFGWYQGNSTINLTANSASGFGISSAVNPLILDGDGKGKTFIVGNTGGIVIDGTGRGALTLRDFTIVQGSSNKSTTGIYLARATATQSQFSQNNVIENVYCDLGTIPAANSSHGTVCGYDFAAEGAHWINDEFNGDNPLVLTADNTFSITSPNQTVLTSINLMTQSIVRGGFYTAEGITAGQSILIQGFADNTRIENVTTEYIGTTVIPAIRITPQVATPSTPIRNLAIVNLQAEAPAGQASQIVNTATLGSPIFTGNFANIAASVFLLNTGNGELINPEVNLFPGNGGVSSPLIADNGIASGGIIGGHVFLALTQTIAFTNSASGCAVDIFSSYNTPSIICNNVVGQFCGILTTPSSITSNACSPGGQTFGSNTGYTFNLQGAPVFSIGSTASQISKPFQLNSVAFASLGTPANGTINYCSDCTVAATCAAAGTGALAKRINSVWVCN